MEENIKVNMEYLEAFNLGYELAKELNLKTPMFEDLSADNTRLNAMQAGMKQYSKEIEVQKNRGSTLDLNIINSIPKEQKDKGKGFDISI